VTAYTRAGASILRSVLPIRTLYMRRTNQVDVLSGGSED
jgi:hypothetical protein